MPIFYEDDARDDLREIVRYGTEQGHPNVPAYVAQLMESIEGIEANPKIGRPGRVQGTRELVLPGTPYIAVYVLDGSDQYVRRVLHGAQKWP